MVILWCLSVFDYGVWLLWLCLVIGLASDVGLVLVLAGWFSLECIGIA